MSDWTEVNRFVGSCPYCGGRIFEKDFVRFEVEPDMPTVEIYKCLHCWQEVSKENLIPF